MTTDPTAISRARPPDLIPGYRLDAVVGRGGMGEVHKATQLSLDRTVAVKVLNPELAKDPQFVVRFEKEAAALATLQHPHIVSIVDKGHTETAYYLVMEFVDGPSLREVMRQPSFDATSALRIVWDVCRAIDYAHTKGVVHRDLKPENILFDQQAGSIPKVSDFGLASFLGDDAGPAKFHVTETHVAMGTASYMAPEQRVDAKNADGRADIYAIGVMLYELLVGELPAGTFAPPSQRKPELDKRLDAIVDRCLKPAVADRFQNLGELLALLEPLVPTASSLTPRKVSSATRLGLAVRSVVRVGLRVTAGLIVLGAAALLATAIIRAQDNHVSIALPGAAIAEERPALTPVPGHARLENAELERVLTFGDGPDTLPLVPYGREVMLEGATVTWADTGALNDVARAKLDASEFDGRALQLSADVRTPGPPEDLRSVVERAVVGYGPEPRAALLLTGEPGRYLALIADGTGKPVSFEWALAEKRGAMLGPPSERVMTLTLAVDRQGEARAFVGSGKDKRQLGEPISLGRDWKKHFGGRMPSAQLGCIDGGCRMSAVRFEVDKDPPPPPPPPPPPVVEVAPPPKEPEKKPAVKPAAAKVKAPVKSTTAPTRRVKRDSSVVDRAWSVIKDSTNTTKPVRKKK